MALYLANSASTTSTTSTTTMEYTKERILNGHGEESMEKSERKEMNRKAYHVINKDALLVWSHLVD